MGMVISRIPLVFRMMVQELIHIQGGTQISELEKFTKMTLA